MARVFLNRRIIFVKTKNSTEMTDAAMTGGSIPSRGYYGVENGPQLLLNALYESRTAVSGASGPAAAESSSAVYEYLGDSRRENGIEAKADQVAFKGIRIKDWIIGANKTHITPLDDMDKCVFVASLDVAMCALFNVVCAKARLNEMTS